MKGLLILRLYKTELPPSYFLFSREHYLGNKMLEIVKLRIQLFFKINLQNVKKF